MIDIYGTLFAKEKNSFNDSIKFDGIENAGFNKILFHYRSTGILEYCTITGSYISSGGVVGIEHYSNDPCQVAIQNNQFIHSGIYLTMWAPFTLRNNRISHGGGIQFEPVTSNNEILE